jgi:hypothetical protein
MIGDMEALLTGKFGTHIGAVGGKTGVAPPNLVVSSKWAVQAGSRRQVKQRADHDSVAIRRNDAAFVGLRFPTDATHAPVEFRCDVDHTKQAMIQAVGNAASAFADVERDRLRTIFQQSAGNIAFCERWGKQVNSCLPCTILMQKWVSPGCCHRAHASQDRH